MKIPQSSDSLCVYDGASGKHSCNGITIIIKQKLYPTQTHLSPPDRRLHSLSQSLCSSLLFHTPSPLSLPRDGGQTITAHLQQYVHVCNNVCVCVCVQEKQSGEKLSEAKVVKLYGQIPLIEKMDSSLSTLMNCEWVLQTDGVSSTLTDIIWEPKRDSDSGVYNTTVH